MKKFLVIVVLAFLINANANATLINCKVDKAFKCESNGCNELNSEISINIDTKGGIAQRTKN